MQKLKDSMRKKVFLFVFVKLMVTNNLTFVFYVFYCDFARNKLRDPNIKSHTQMEYSSLLIQLGEVSHLRDE